MNEQNNNGYQNGSFGNSGGDWENKSNEPNGYGRPNGNYYGGMPNNGYGNYPNNGGYPNGYGNYPNKWDVGPNENIGWGFAIAAIVTALVNMVIFKNIFTIISAPLCLIFAIICFKKHGRGKGLAIAGIVISVISTLIFAFYVVLIARIVPDVKYFVENDKEIVSEFKENGTIPDRYEKYLEPKFGKYWKIMGYDSFNEFFSDFVKGYKSEVDGRSYSFGNGEYSYDDDENDTDEEDQPFDSYSDEDGDGLPDEDSGEELVIL